MEMKGILWPEFQNASDGSRKDADTVHIWRQDEYHPPQLQLWGTHHHKHPKPF